jgi:spore coat protein CotF
MNHVLSKRQSNTLIENEEPIVTGMDMKSSMQPFDLEAKKKNKILSETNAASQSVVKPIHAFISGRI